MTPGFCGEWIKLIPGGRLEASGGCGLRATVFGRKRNLIRPSTTTPRPCNHGELEIGEVGQGPKISLAIRWLFVCHNW